MLQPSSRKKSCMPTLGSGTKDIGEKKAAVTLGGKKGGSGCVKHLPF
jgi:hypothetical protein